MSKEGKLPSLGLESTESRWSASAKTDAEAVEKQGQPKHIGKLQDPRGSAVPGTMSSGEPGNPGNLDRHDRTVAPFLQPKPNQK